MNLVSGRCEKVFRERPVVWGESWNIGFVLADPADLLAGCIGTSEPTWLFGGADDWFPSDPCLVESDARRYVFYERFDRVAARGSIWCVEFDHRNTDSPLQGAARCVLQEPFHLSHPFVFHHAGQWYLIPEAAQSGSVRLYRSPRFPWEWEPAGILLQGFPGLDPTLVVHKERYWLFTARLGPGHDANVHVFHAPQLIGPWSAHPANPVKSGRLGSRPAGSFFSVDGRLYRPAQDSRHTYGQAIVIHEVLQLDQGAYRETTVARLEPQLDWLYSRGAHSLCVGDGYMLIDAKRFTGLKRFAGPPLTRLRRGLGLGAAG